MTKLSLERRRVVVMAAGLGALAATTSSVGGDFAEVFHLSRHVVVLSMIVLELLGLVYVLSALVKLKRAEGGV